MNFTILEKLERKISLLSMYPTLDFNIRQYRKSLRADQVASVSGNHELCMKILKLDMSREPTSLRLDL